MTEHLYAIGVDLGGTKIEIGKVNMSGIIEERMRFPTDVKGGPKVIENQIIQVIEDLRSHSTVSLVGVGVGVAGQIDATSGAVHFAPNLNWHNVPLQEDLSRALNLPVIVTNDVRAATWGEWFFGAGHGTQDLVCLFVGTGIGGGIVSGGQILLGSSNTCGEVGHMIIDLHGPPCTCGNIGCLEALAGGWAIAKQAQAAIKADPESGHFLLQSAGGRIEQVTAKNVAEAYKQEDKLAQLIMDDVLQALIAGSVNLVNVCNPSRLILGGGFLEGLPEIIPKIEEGVRKKALSTATANLKIIPAKLRHDAGVIGAATLVIHQLTQVKDAYQKEGL